jgi:cell division protein FtsI/penicillin-binding protein 2
MKYLAAGINVGSTKNAYVKGYRVAAKTGTAAQTATTLAKLIFFMWRIISKTSRSNLTGKLRNIMHNW